jgi:hypothetical protein
MMMMMMMIDDAIYSISLLNKKYPPVKLLSKSVHYLKVQRFTNK